MHAAELVDEADPALPVFAELRELVGIDLVAQVHGDHQGRLVSVGSEPCNAQSPQRVSRCRCIPVQSTVALRDKPCRCPDSRTLKTGPRFARTDERLPVNITLLRRFVAVAEELHFPRAAEALGIPLASLYTSIEKLEAEVGHPLFTRQGDTQLTKVG
ncbi:MAG TPA: LysR family transcriptional regulator, partial [Microbacterium sp.]|uniref:helix-turn-helix domain-containing protein n=1 Tax=Microbacterium sp. TaxID=51671 RepID=UPI002F931FB8